MRLLVVLEDVLAIEVVHAYANRNAKRARPRRDQLGDLRPRELIPNHDGGADIPDSVDDLPLLNTRRNGDRVLGYRADLNAEDLYRAGTPPMHGLASRGDRSPRVSLVRPGQLFRVRLEGGRWLVADAVETLGSLRWAMGNQGAIHGATGEPIRYPDRGVLRGLQRRGEPVWCRRRLSRSGVSRWGMKRSQTDTRDDRCAATTPRPHRARHPARRETGAAQCRRY